MTERLKGSQIFGLSLNSNECISSTNNSLGREPLCAFASEHICLIYNRTNYNKKVIATPDPSAYITAIAFINDEFIFCSNSKGILYKYSLKNYEKPLHQMNIGYIPSSMTSSEKKLFIISSPYILTLDIGNNELTVLSETQTHLEVSVSPCGRAFASFKKGQNSPSPVIWYEPFEKHIRSSLPLQGGVNDFQWGLTTSLTAVTAGVDNVVRIWFMHTVQRRQFSPFCMHSIVVLLILGE